MRKRTLAAVALAWNAAALAAPAPSPPAVAPSPAAALPDGAVAALSQAAAVPSPASQTRLIDVGGRRVAFHVVPGRLPAVVFEAGGGMDGSAWDPVLGTIARDTGAELVTFDRAGFGDSDEDTRPVQIQHEADDLKAGLAALGIDHGIVLVAHSFGGEVAFPLASQNPGLVARAVLVDGTVPSFCTDEEMARMASTFPKDVEQDDKQGRTWAAFFAAWPAMQHGFHEMRWPDSVPATVIVSEHPPFMTPAENAAWTQDHVDFAHAAANRSVEIAEGSGHIVMNDRPDLVSQAVVAAVEQVRQAAQR
ncbi:MAG: alpha/beta fold hydrolase [Janthinobacterium lividum]